MKRLQDYLNKNFDSIYENFEADHILTKEEINQSFNRVINEGFWSWLGDLIKSLFSDDTSKETKEYCGKALTYFREEWGDEVEKLTTKLLQEKDVKKFLEKVEQERVKLVKNNTFKDEEQSYCWAIFTLKQKIKLLTDEKKTNDIKLIEEKIKEYSKKANDSLQRIEQEIDNVELPNEGNNESQAPSEELGKSVPEAFKQHENTIKELCDKCNTTPETVQKIVYTICGNVKETQNITDPNVAYGLILMTIGGYMTKDLPNRSTVVSLFKEIIVKTFEQTESQSQS